MIGAWYPDFAPWVQGVPTHRDPEDPIKIEMRCLVCGEAWRAYCYSGQWYRRVQYFAIAHIGCWARPLDERGPIV